MTQEEQSPRSPPGGAGPSAGGLGRLEDVDSEGPPRGVHAMALVRWALVALMAVIAVLSVSYSFGLVASGPASAAAAQYYCPMHPQVVQDHPGECPICSMTLVKKETEGKHAGSDGPSIAKGVDLSTHATAGEHAGHRHNPSDPYFCPMHPEETGLDASARCPICEMKLEKHPAKAAPKTASRNPGDAVEIATPGSTQGSNPLPPIPGLVPIELSLDRIQNIGVRTAAATLEALAPELRAVGFVSADESRLARVHTRFSGWIERLDVATTGQKVARGQVLAGLYNLELLPAQQEFLAARRWSSGASGSVPQPRGAGESIERDARARLELFGLSRAEIDDIAESGKPSRTVAVTAPIGGYVVSKSAVQGAFVQPGTELFEIADLSKVWVLVDVYEYEVGRVRVGQTAEVSVGAHPGERFAGKVGFLYPVIDPSTRTLRVRIELDNRGMKLRPGMYAAATIQLDAARATVIPTEALVDTGEHQYVFLVKGGGRFEPRPVKAGHRENDKVQILEGLTVGDVVVTTANFLIDSESRLHAAIQGPDEPGGKLEVSTCDVDIDKAAFPEKYDACLACERVHRGMGTMDQDCKNAITRPWR
jgi:Cu(I)/Ag(I) efflux system membrane fusion protein